MLLPLPGLLLWFSSASDPTSDHGWIGGAVVALLLIARAAAAVAAKFQHTGDEPISAARLDNVQYQVRLEQWLMERGLDPKDDASLKLAISANPYRPAPLAPPAAVPDLALPASPPAPPPEQVRQLLDACPCPWWVGGGWAIDLWLGRRTRPHADIEVIVLRADQLAFRDYLVQFRFSSCWPGGDQCVEEPLAADEIVQPPVHELHAHRFSGAHAPGAISHLEVLLNEADGALWRYRRDPRITRPIAQLGALTADCTPYLAPEVVLLYKAGLWRPPGSDAGDNGAPVQLKDEQDFTSALPQLAAAQRTWLHNAIALAHPGHPWLARLLSTEWSPAAGA